MIFWLASYPRSGNTFLRILLKSCFGLNSFSQYNDVLDIGSDDTFSDIVGHSMYSDSWDEFYQKSKESNDLKVIKTHHAPTDSAKTIYLVRDPRSVVVSFHNYLQDFSPLTLARQDTIMGATAFGSWGQHVTSWQPTKREDTMVVHFERLIEEPSAIADEIAEFLGLEKISDDIPSFSELRDINSSFFRTGSNQKNISTLNSEELNLLTFLFKDQMKQLGYEHSERVNRSKALDSIMSVSKNIWSLQHEVKHQLEENSKRLGVQEKMLAEQHLSEIDKVRGEQREFVDQLISSIQSSGVQAEALAKQSIALTEKFGSTNEQLQDLWSQKSGLTATVELQRIQQAELQEALAEAEAQSGMLQSENRSHTEAAAQKDLEIVALRANAAAIAELQSEIAQAKSDNKDLSELLGQKELEVASLKAEEAAHSALLTEIEQLRSELRNQDDLYADVSDTKHHAQQLEFKCDELARTLEQTKSTKKKLDAKIAYRDRVIEASRLSLAETKAVFEARTSEIERLNAQLYDNQNRVDKFQNLVAELTAQKIDREQSVRELETELETIHSKTLNLSNRNQELQTKYEFMKAHFMEVSQAVAPRLKSILTLKPMRFVVNRRALVKQGALTLDGNGMPVPEAVEFDPPLDPNRKTVPSAVNRPKYIGSGHKSSIYQGYKSKKPLGIAVYTFDRTESVENVLESLHLQEGLADTHVWIDGDQGNQKRRARLDQAEKCVSGFPVKQVHRNRGNYGFRKMMIVSMRKMFEMYDRVLFLEDDCFPTRHALNGFSYELDQIENDPNVFSVYGHPFLINNEKEGPIGRFQGWGWATTREKLMSLWPALLETYLMSEDEYKAFIEKELTDEILARLDVTPGRQPSSTLPKFFAWDEALGFLAAQKSLTHKRTSERLIYNFGVGRDSTHFNNIDHYRKPPFNMITIDEIWSHY